jgi:hypothetical protein
MDRDKLVEAWKRYGATYNVFVPEDQLMPSMEFSKAPPYFVNVNLTAEGNQVVRGTEISWSIIH